MARTEGLGHRRIVGRTGVSIPDHESYGSAGSHTVENSREKFRLVGLAARGRSCRRVGTTASHHGIDGVKIYLEAGGHPVENAANGCAVRFAESGKSQQLSERIHSASSSPASGPTTISAV